MTSTHNTIISPEKNEHDHFTKPSAIGNFLARFGSQRNRSKSPIPTNAQKNKAATLNSCTSHNNSQHEKSLEKYDRKAPGDLTPTKPTRHSSPFVRVIHRLSMNRKTRYSTESTPRRNHDEREAESFSRDRKMFYATTSPSTAEIAASEIVPRPAVSENDLRSMSLRREQDLEGTTLILSNATNYHSEDNLRMSIRVPSYLRVSCALNGYRQTYKRPSNSLLNRKQLPMSIVERRTLAFNNLKETEQSSVKSPLNRSAEPPMDVASETSTPVRNLVAQFDRANLSADGEAIKRSNKSAEDALALEPSHNGNDADEATSNLITNWGSIGDDDLVEPLENSFSHTTRNSIPVSDKVYDSILSEISPRPSVAEVVHCAVWRNAVEECVPNFRNQNQVLVESASSEQLIVSNNTSQQMMNVAEPLNGETYRDLLINAREYLIKKSGEALEDLKNDSAIPEHANGILRTTAGKATLLIERKMSKFSELVEKNLNFKNNDAQPAMLNDLAAYWELINIEFEELKRNFVKIDELRNNNWIGVDTSMNGIGNLRSPNGGVKKIHQISSVVIDEKRLAADAQRRQEALAEAKRRQKELMRNDQGSFEQCDNAVKMII